MRPAGIFLLLAGWGIVLSAVVLFTQQPLRGVFVFAGLGIEVLGLALLFRGQAKQQETT